MNVALKGEGPLLGTVKCKRGAETVMEISFFKIDFKNTTIECRLSALLWRKELSNKLSI